MSGSMTTLEATTPPSVSAEAASPQRSRAWQLAVAVLVGAELAVLYAPTVAWLLDRWTMSVWHHAHGLLIPPVVGYFAYHELKRLAHLPPSGSALGFVLLVPALVLHALDAGMHTQLLSAAALILAIAGLSLLLLGVERTRAIAFPLAFLLFALPIPLAFTEEIHWQLRQVMTAASATILPWFGIPLFVEGTTLHMANGSLQIADACSGFSTLYAAAAVACLTAYSSSSPMRRALVLVTAAPLAVAANLLRVVGLVLVVVWKGSGILDTFVHPLSGILTFVLVLPIIFWLGGDTKGGARS